MGWTAVGGTTIPGPCADEAPRTEEKCVTGVGCWCECPEGSTWRSAVGICQEDDPPAWTSGELAPLEDPVAGEEDIPEGSSYGDTRESPSVGGLSAAEKSDDTPEIDSGPRADIVGDPGAAEYAVEDITGPPEGTVRKFTIRRTSVFLDRLALGDHYAQYRVDRLALGGIPIDDDTFEVIYGRPERRRLRSEYGCIINPQRHNKVLNSVFLSFANEMLRTQVQSVQSFNHIKQHQLSNEQITPNSIATTPASVESVSQEQAAKRERMRRISHGRGGGGPLGPEPYRPLGLGSGAPTGPRKPGKADPFGSRGSRPGILGGGGGAKKGGGGGLGGM